MQALDVIESSGMEPGTVALLKGRFLPFLEQAREWKQRAQGLVVTDESQVREMRMAREARLALREIRINADKARKEMKADALAYGRAVQGVYNTIEAAIKPIEEHLFQQEQFVEIQAQKRREELNAERQGIAGPLMNWIDVDLPFNNAPWAHFTESEFRQIVHAALSAKDAEEAEAARLEAERLAREKAEAEERDRLRKENERLRAERAELERQQAEERRKMEEQARKEQEEAEKKLAAERAERERIQEEARRKEQAEAARRTAEEEARARAEAAPDKERLLAFAADISGISSPAVKSKSAKALAERIDEKITELACWIREQAEKI